MYTQPIHCARAGTRTLLSVAILLLVAGRPTLSYTPLAEAATPFGSTAPGSPMIPAMSNDMVPRVVLDGMARYRGAVDPRQMLRVVFALKPPHLAAEEQFLRAVQAPD